MGGSCRLNGEMRNSYKILVGKPERKDYFEELGVDGKIILEWVFGKKVGKFWTACMWLRLGVVL